MTWMSKSTFFGNLSLLFQNQGKKCILCKRCSIQRQKECKCGHVDTGQQAHRHLWTLLQETIRWVKGQFNLWIKCSFVNKTKHPEIMLWTPADTLSWRLGQVAMAILLGLVVCVNTSKCELWVCPCIRTIHTERNHRTHLYRWVPFNPNMDNPSSRLIRKNLTSAICVFVKLLHLNKMTYSVKFLAWQLRTIPQLKWHINPG